MPDEELYALKDRAAAVLMRIPGVTGVGLGGRERDGRPTGETVLKVFVERKRPTAELAPGETIPEQFEGLGIDVCLLVPGELETAPVEEEAPPHVVPGSPLVSENDTDDGRYRPLIGGSRVAVDLTGGGYGTFGCVLLHKTDPGKIYVLTNWHVVTADGGKVQPVKGTTRAGQSEARSSATKCCSHMIGTLVAGGRDTVRDAALIQLDAGIEYKKEIIGIGTVTGTHTVTVAEATPLNYAVRKRGARTRLTGGIVEAVGTTHTTKDGLTRTNVMVTKPNLNIAVKAGDPLYFNDRGDSGSVLVNDKGEAVTLHYGGSFVAALKMNKSLSLPIEQMLGLFDTQDHVPVQMATATTLGVVFPVPGATTVALPQELVPALTGAPAGEEVRVPVEAAWLPGVPLPTPELLTGLERQLDESAAGRSLITLWLRHHEELIGLIDGHRRVALVWHRCGGPALLQMFVRMVHTPALRMPETINGRPLSESLNRICDTFAAYATPPLRDDLLKARGLLPDLAGLSFPQILDALRRA
ncbi:MAG: trypsin-like serine protease [Streptosporangiales bacterium]|nr:trypsin-like serine protease [Streptosporangiales bacterium]